MHAAESLGVGDLLENRRWAINLEDGRDPEMTCNGLGQQWLWKQIPSGGLQ
jgi:hypothetical protein